METMQNPSISSLHGSDTQSAYDGLGPYLTAFWGWVSSTWRQGELASVTGAGSFSGILRNLSTQVIGVFRLRKS